MKYIILLAFLCGCPPATVPPQADAWVQVPVPAGFDAGSGGK